MIRRLHESVFGAGFSLLLVAALLSSLRLSGAEVSASDAVLDAWLKATGNLATLEARVVQTRHLKALRQPLVSTGRVWFATPGRFRWELGEPPRSVAVRSGEELLVLSPGLRRAERHRLDQAAEGPVKELLGLLDVGFPRDAAEFRARFDVLEVRTNAAATTLRLRPRAAAARRMMPGVSVDLGVGDWRLLATEMTFADGSRLRSDFSAMITNAPVDPVRFRTEVPEGWKTETQGGGL